MIRIKVIWRKVGTVREGTASVPWSPCQPGTGHSPIFEHNGCRFIYDADCRDYDWLVAYDEVPRNAGSVKDECEDLACPREHTILVTMEPPTIKVYPTCYTKQFAYLLTTHTPFQMPHPNHRYSEGGPWWCADCALEELFSMPEYEKTCELGTVCSAKQQTHTLHRKRYNLTKYLSNHLPQMDWYGRGVKPLANKHEALFPYRYHVAMENYIAPYHWTDKISDPILGLCLTFYAGDPRLGEIFPPESFIPIPADDPAEACRIISEAVKNNEYEKRLPAIREARRLLIEKYNFYSQVAALVHEVQAAEKEPPAFVPFKLKGRHRLRRNPVNAITEAWEIIKVRWALKRNKC